MIPFLFLLFGLGSIAAFAISRKPQAPPSSNQGLITSTEQVKGAVWVRDDPTKNLRLLRRVIAEKKSPQRWLVNEAMREAYDLGDWQTVASLSTAFSAPTSSIAFETQSESSPVESSGSPQLIIGKNSPLKGVSNEEWTAFVDQLRTGEPSHRTDKHVGMYHHHIDRLNQLSIDPSTLTDESSQYAALEKDLSDYRASERKLINDFCGDVITLKGQVTPITESGILGVMKAAGPKNARSWFKNESERESFPRTTETFLKTNGVF